MINKILLFNAIFILFLLACERAPSLNSERIAARFGNVGIEILRADDAQRVTSLFSEDPQSRMRTMRTLALVDFLGADDPEVSAEHEEIVAGGSIGEVFRRHGWRIEKLDVVDCQTIADESTLPLLRDMGVDLAQALATSRYRFRVHRAGHSVDYAAIAEIYHPDYIPAATLVECTADIIGEH